MTKADLVELIADKKGYSKDDVKSIVESLLQEVKNAMAAGEHIEIRGFGTFRVKKNPAKQARNPKTGEKISVPAKKKVILKVSREVNKLLY